MDNEWLSCALIFWKQMESIFAILLSNSPEIDKKQVFFIIAVE